MSFHSHMGSETFMMCLNRACNDKGRSVVRDDVPLKTYCREKSDSFLISQILHYFRFPICYDIWTEHTKLTTSTNLRSLDLLNGFSEDFHVTLPKGMLRRQKQNPNDSSSQEAKRFCRDIFQFVRKLFLETRILPTILSTFAYDESCSQYHEKLAWHFLLCKSK